MRPKPNPQKKRTPHAGKSTKKMKNRFLKFVRSEHNGCWIWTGAKNPRGYGAFYLGGKVVNSHRASMLIFKADVLIDGMTVCHSCDNPACVNPDHLWVGTQKDNITDCISKKRKNTASSRGEKSGKSTIGNAQAISIFGLKGKKTRREISMEFGISMDTVSKIFNGLRWSSVTGALEYRNPA